MANVRISKKLLDEKKEIKFCPKCKSENIGMNVNDAFSAFVGSHPGWKCNNCGLQLPEFPLKNKIVKKTKK